MTKTQELEKKSNQLATKDISQNLQEWKIYSQVLVKKYFTKESLLILSSALIFIVLRPEFKKEWLLPLIAIISMFFYFYGEEIKDFPLIENLPLIGAVTSGFGGLILYSQKKKIL